jgi:gamma-glutamyl-gamma-aminobutyrate hydrolase PuuD
MRLVSVLYQEFHPFDTWNVFDAFICLNDVDQLRPGDCLIIHGGADIHPSLYNKAKSIQSQAYELPSKRDILEWNFIQRARELGCPVIGICRGAQMLCAVAGGYLMQHVTGHGGSHLIQTNDGREYVVNSLHHQLMVPDKTNHIVYAQIRPDRLRSHVYWDEERQVDHKQEPEFIYFKDIKGFAVQWHPEMLPASNEGTTHLKQVMEENLAFG